MSEKSTWLVAIPPKSQKKKIELYESMPKMLDNEERSRSSESVGRQDAKDSESMVNKLKEKNKDLRQKVDELEKQFKSAMQELHSYKVIVEASLNRPQENNIASNIQPSNENMDTETSQAYEIYNRKLLKRVRPDEHNLAGDERVLENHSSSSFLSNQFDVLANTEEAYPPLPKKTYKMPNATQSSIKTNIKPGSLTRTATKDNSSKASSFNSNMSSANTKANHSQANTNVTAEINVQNKPKNSKVRPPPPIVCYNLDSKAAYTQFKNILGHCNFDLDGPHGNATYVRTRTRTDYDIIAAAAEESQLDHHRYTPHDQRITNVLLFRMCPSYSAEDITNGINELELDITIHNVMRFESEKSRMEHPSRVIWLIQLAPGSDVTALLKTRKLLCQTNINFERRKNNGIIQCKNCQHFGHTANNCSRPFRCVKCHLPHGPKECPTDAPNQSETPRKKPACVNCGGLDHPANFRGCPSYSALIRRKQTRILEHQKQQELQQLYVSNYRKEGVSYSKIFKENTQNKGSVAQKNTTSNAESNPIDYLQKECLRLFNNDLFSIMEKCKEFVPRHKSITDHKQQAISVLNFISSITN